MDGVVQGLLYRTVGGVIAPGAQVANVVPSRDTVEAEVRVAASDVGHVHVGQPVRVKVSAFDFLRYGSLDGKVTMVSANSTTTEKGEIYFLTRVALDRAELEKASQNGKLQSGMTLEADIITDRQSVLHYLLRPVYAAFSSGFGER
jgi:HlyD family type I secretion membrane fusion protein